MQPPRDGNDRHIIIAGGGFAGLAAAYTAKQRLGPSDRVTLVEPSGQFVFGPSMVWTAFGRQLHHSSFPLHPALSEHGIEYVRSAVNEVRIADYSVATGEGELRYDRLIIATGGRPRTDAVPGLAGQFQMTHWIVGEDSAMETRQTLERFFANPGPVVVGVAPNASYISAAYEIVLMLDTALRERRLRDRVSLTFVTAEPHLGELGYGQNAAQKPLEQLFAERGIAYRAGVEISGVERDRIKLDSGESIPAQMSIVMPPFTGAVDIWKSAKLTDDSGLIPINRHYQHVNHPDVYAAGVSAYFAQPVPPLPTGRAPHTGYLSMRMGKLAAQNAAASLGCGKAADRTLPHLLDVRILDAEDVGLLVTARGDLVLENDAQVLPGQVAHYLKLATERTLMHELRTGDLDLL